MPTRSRLATAAALAAVAGLPVAVVAVLVDAGVQVRLDEAAQSAQNFVWYTVMAFDTFVWTTIIGLAMLRSAHGTLSSLLKLAVWIATAWLGLALPAIGLIPVVVEDAVASSFWQTAWIVVLTALSGGGLAYGRQRYRYEREQQCAFCCSWIDLAATRCPACTSWLPTTPVQNPRTSTPSSLRESAHVAPRGTA